MIRISNKYSDTDMKQFYDPGFHEQSFNKYNY